MSPPIWTPWTCLLRIDGRFSCASSVIVGEMSQENRSRTEAGDRELLTVEQAAHYLHLSPSSIRSYIRLGKLKVFRVAGLREVLVAHAQLLLLLEPTKACEDQAPGP